MKSLQREGAVSHSLVAQPGQLGDLQQKFSQHSLLFLRLFSYGNQLDPGGKSLNMCLQSIFLLHNFPCLSLSPCPTVLTHVIQYPSKMQARSREDERVHEQGRGRRRMQRAARPSYPARRRLGYLSARSKFPREGRNVRDCQDGRVVRWLVLAGGGGDCGISQVAPFNAQQIMQI